VRARAPPVIYDERFVSHPLLRQAEVHVRGHETPTHELGDPGIEVPSALARADARARLAQWAVPVGGSR
jgi:hypothetical protein